MTDVVKKVWGFCNYLKHDGMNYGLYIEQITYILFLKMAHEKEIKLPKGCNWSEFISFSGSDLTEHYSNILKTLGKEKGLLGAIFQNSSSAFKKAANLKKLLNDFDLIEWTRIDIDIKAAIYEGLLKKYASAEKGAGQYFTPRPLIRSIVRCVKPEYTTTSNYLIHDPACGTCGFLIAAFEWIMKETDEGSKLKIPDRERLIKKTFSGGDLEENTRRLGLMNCYLHEIEADVYNDDSLAEGSHVNKKYDLVLTNPPFGSRGAGTAPNRDDFLISTANKQLNFVQHVLTILGPRGRCAMVVPDGILKGEETDAKGRGVRENLLKTCNLHTILRLPEGTFIPYANQPTHVIFFTKGTPTEDVWIYDLRTNVQNITKKKNPLTEEHFEDFEKCYSQKPRKETDIFKKFSKKQIEDDNFNLAQKFVKDKSIIDLDALPKPEIIANDISNNLESALKSINKIALSFKI